MIESDAILPNSKNFDPNKCEGCFSSIVNFETYPDTELLNIYLLKGTYELSCPYGHNTIVCLQDFDFSIAFELGALGLIDNHYTSSLLNFQNALESFYRWCIEIFILEYDPEEKKKMWKFLRRQSERQIGAFISLYSIYFKRMPMNFQEQKFITANNCGEFRNKFIHSGYRASREEAFKYGKMILSYVRALIVEFREKYNDKIEKLTDLHIENLRTRNKSIPPTIRPLGGILSIVGNETIKDLTFGHRLEYLQKNKFYQQKKKEILWSSLD